MDRPLKDKMMLLYPLEVFEDTFQNGGEAKKAYQMSLEMMERILLKYYDYLQIKKHTFNIEMFMNIVGEDLYRVNHQIKNIKLLIEDEKEIDKNISEQSVQ
jgi:hypothetical protein